MEQSISNERRTLNLEEAARLLGIGRTLAYEAVRRGDFPVPVIRVGHRWVVPRAPLDDLLAGRTPAGR